MKIIKERRLKENSLGKLDKPELVDKIVDFIRSNPFPIDSDFHKFAQDSDFEPDQAEEYCYAMLTVILCGGKSKGKKPEASDENWKIGLEIEKEHVDYDTTDEVVKHIQGILKQKIAADHLTETDMYYIDGVNFKNELKQERD